MKLFTRFFLVLLLFAMLPVMATGVWMLRSSEAAIENARHMHEQVTQLFSDTVESSVAEMNRAFGFVADLQHVERLGGISPGEEYKQLQRAAAAHSEFALLSILDAAGHERIRLVDPQYFPGSSYEDRSKDPTVRKALDTGTFTPGPVVLMDGRPLLTLAYPLSQGQCLYAVYSFQGLWERVAHQKVGKEGRVLLLDSSGKVLPGISSDFPEPNWTGLSAPSGASGWIDKLPTKAGTMLGAYTRAPSLSWWILSLQPRSEALTLGDKFVAQAVAFLVALALLVSGCAYWLTGVLTRPIQALVLGAQRVSRNEFTTPVPEAGWAELKLLSKSFNEMMRTLHSYQELQVERILEEKAKVEALVHTIPDGILLASFDGSIVYMNLAARALLATHAVKGKAKTDTVHEVIRDPALNEMVLSLLHRQKTSQTREIELRNPGGARMGVYLCRGVTVMRERKEVGILVLLRNITAERELDKMKEDFFHSVVHDISNPLATMNGFIQIMEEKYATMDPNSLKTYLTYLRDSCNVLRKLVTDILDTAKIESGTLKLNIAPAKVSEMLDKMRSLYVLPGQSKGIEVRIEGSSVANSEITCDRELLERVLMNLIGNAMKFTPKGGKITVAAAMASVSDIEFSVADTGPGIPQDKLEFVFEKFKQLEDTAAKRSGYGLGLAICKKVVELHGGRIWVESKLQQGSRFAFRIPCKPAALTASSPAA